MGYKLDEKDKKILEILKEHGDYTTRQIAKKTLLPVTTIHNRITKLKKEKIIKKFTIEIEPKSIDKDLMIYVLISINIEHLKEKKMSQQDVTKVLRQFYFTERVDIVAGGTDLVAIIRVKDVEEYNNILLNKIQHVEGIRNTQSLIVIKEK